MMNTPRFYFLDFISDCIGFYSKWPSCVMPFPYLLMLIQNPMIGLGYKRSPNNHIQIEWYTELEIHFNYRFPHSNSDSNEISLKYKFLPGHCSVRWFCIYHGHTSVQNFLVITLLEFAWEQQNYVHLIWIVMSKCVREVCFKSIARTNPYLVKSI